MIFKPHHAIWKASSSLALCLVGSISSTAQTSAPVKSTAKAPASTAKRTADGQPDIQGTWVRAGIYGLAPQLREANGPRGAENPLDDAAFSSLPGVERAGRGPRGGSDDYQPQGEGARAVELEGPPPTGSRKLGIIDPADKILPWKPEEDKKRRAFLLRTSPPASLRYVEFDARCALPGFFLNGGPYEFLQTDKKVVILSEYSHYTRTIFLDGRPHLGSGIRMFMGDSTGHWEGKTLVVDTTNFNEFTSFTREIPYFSDALHTIERFTIADRNNIDYEVTIDDQKLFTKPWKIAGLYRRGKKSYEMAEYACAEGSMTLENIFGTPPKK